MKQKDLLKNLTNQRRANESSLMTIYQDETILSNALNRRFSAQVIFNITKLEFFQFGVYGVLLRSRY